MRHLLFSDLVPHNTAHLGLLGMVSVWGQLSRVGEGEAGGTCWQDAGSQRASLEPWAPSYCQHSTSLGSLWSSGWGLDWHPGPGHPAPSLLAEKSGPQSHLWGAEWQQPHISQIVQWEQSGH